MSTAMMASPNGIRPLHRPADVARLLGCSEWWVKEQARQRRIPYTWIGGCYRFTDEHVAEIVRRFEVAPLSGPPAASTVNAKPRAPQTTEGAATVLVARPPGRLRRQRKPSSQVS